MVPLDNYGKRGLPSTIRGKIKITPGAIDSGSPWVGAFALTRNVMSAWGARPGEKMVSVYREIITSLKGSTGRFFCTLKSGFSNSTCDVALAIDAAESIDTRRSWTSG